MDTTGNSVLKKPGLILVILIVTVILGCIGTAAAADLPSNQVKTQVIMYLVGSNLESQGGTGTDDIVEIINGYGNTDPKNLDVIVAFGGANKTGWKGMKIATMDDLKRDGQDGKFGNGNYLYSDPSADMGSGQSFSKFLSTA
ncbi:MAG: clostripain-related cysteine peptidase, partial [Methanoregula sp.]|nr:clostripain-related cysteine peptidase [Methanoregula sp.]